VQESAMAGLIQSWAYSHPSMYDQLELVLWLAFCFYHIHTFASHDPNMM
jgi:hypothetical protein